MGGSVNMSDVEEGRGPRGGWDPGSLSGEGAERGCAAGDRRAGEGQWA